MAVIHKTATPLLVVAAIAFTLVNSAARAQQFFTERTSFVEKIDTAYYEETFNGWSTGEPLDGHQDEWDGPGANGFSWTASAPGPGNQRLYSLDGAISTSSHSDSLKFSFSDGPVYAFGGSFWGTRFDGTALNAEVHFETDTGESFSHVVSATSFIGFISDVPLANVHHHRAWFRSCLADGE